MSHLRAAPAADGSRSARTSDARRAPSSETPHIRHQTAHIPHRCRSLARESASSTDTRSTGSSLPPVPRTSASRAPRSPVRDLCAASPVAHPRHRAASPPPARRDHPCANYAKREQPADVQAWWSCGCVGSVQRVEVERGEHGMNTRPPIRALRASGGISRIHRPRTLRTRITRPVPPSAPLPPHATRLPASP